MILSLEFILMPRKLEIRSRALQFQFMLKSFPEAKMAQQAMKILRS
jgi:hypothetical protein